MEFKYKRKKNTGPTLTHLTSYATWNSCEDPIPVWMNEWMSVISLFGLIMEIVSFHDVGGSALEVMTYFQKVGMKILKTENIEAIHYCLLFSIQ